MIVDQAIFTSARTERLDGYQLVAATDGISAEERQSLTRWCPAHDSLAERSPEAVSVNFHPLAGSRFCISRTMAAGAEYSGRSGPRICTQCFVVTPGLLAKFSNNPLRVLEAISASGHLKNDDNVPARLEPFRLVGRASVTDRSLLRELRSDPICRCLMSVVAAITDSQSVCIVDKNRSPDFWPKALFSVLPVQCRTHLTFCTGLEHSRRRPFRVVVRRTLPSDVRRAAQRGEWTLVDLNQPEPVRSPSPQGWALIVDQFLKGGTLAAWDRLLRCNLPGVGIDNLNTVALEVSGDQLQGVRPEIAAVSG